MEAELVAAPLIRDRIAQGLVHGPGRRRLRLGALRSSRILICLPESERSRLLAHPAESAVVAARRPGG